MARHSRPVWLPGVAYAQPMMRPASKHERALPAMLAAPGVQLGFGLAACWPPPVPCATTAWARGKSGHSAQSTACPIRSTCPPGPRADRGQPLDCVPGSVNTRPSPLVLSSSRTRKPADTLSCLGIAGGAVYDALVALAAKEHGGSPRDPGRAGMRHL